jgi:hypothetical protein
MSIDSQTFRERIKIPELPENTDSLSKLPTFHMHKAAIVNNELIFNDSRYFDDVLRTGFFLLEIPPDLNVDSADSFANNFFREKSGDADDKYKGYKNVIIPGDYQGYFDRPNDQWKNFYIEKNNWKQFLSEDVIESGTKMAQLGINIIGSMLRKLSIPSLCWDKVTGGLTENKGHQMLAFNHFRFEKPMRGTKLHRDSGWVTVLRSTEPGLIGFIDGTLYSINPEPGYFIINFGSSFEVLTEKLPAPVRANIHGVVRTLQKPHRLSGRTSYVIFLDSDLSSNIYRYQNNEVVPIQTMKEFAIQEVNRTYDDGTYL